jgi:hypothetical protein
MVIANDAKEFLTKAKDYLLDDNVCKRICGRGISLYFQDKETYTNALNSLESFIKVVYEPVNDTEMSALKNDHKITICNVLPRKKYKYKIHLKEMPINIRESFIRWYKPYKDKEIKLSPSTQRRLENDYYMKYRGHFFYIENQEMLILASMIIPGYIARVEEFVLRSDINSDNLQEKECQL